MNVCIISNDKAIIREVERHLNVVLNKFIYQKYNSFNGFISHRRNFVLDCLIIDTDMDQWQEHAKQIKNDFQNVNIIFIGSDLCDGYKEYDIDHIAFVYKGQMDYLDAAIKKIKPVQNIDSKDFVHYKWKSVTYVVKSDDVLYFERDKRRTVIHMLDGSTRLTYKGLDEFQEENPELFKRAHNSFLVNRHHFKTYTREAIELIDGTMIPISRKYIDDFKEMFN